MLETVPDRGPDFPEMLGQRVATAAVLLAGFAAILFLAPRWLFVMFLVVVAAFASWEWARLAQLPKRNLQYAYAAFVSGNCTLLLMSPFPLPVVWISCGLASLLWLVLLFRLRHFDPEAPAPGASGPGRGPLGLFWPQWNLALLGLVLISSVAVAIHALRHVVEGHATWLLLYALAVVWFMDIGAYFFGRHFGRRKLAPAISPGKTQEGVYGGLLATGVLFVLAVLLARGSWALSPTWLLPVTLAAALASVVGELPLSSRKRHARVKDSSQLLPGHGGVLDRIDGVLAALPLFVLLWLVTTLVA